MPQSDTVAESRPGDHHDSAPGRLGRWGAHEGFPMSIALTTTLTGTDFDTVVQRTRNALAEQGFGVLTEIDMQATMKAKLDEDMERYLILGACNPPLAHRAVGVMRQIGLLLPCNVVVREDPDNADVIIVDAMNPDIMVDATGEPALVDVARDAATKLRAAIATLAEEPTPDS